MSKSTAGGSSFASPKLQAIATKFLGIECFTRPSLRTLIFTDVRVGHKQLTRWGPGFENFARQKGSPKRNSRARSE